MEYPPLPTHHGHSPRIEPCRNSQIIYTTYRNSRRIFGRGDLLLFYQMTQYIIQAYPHRQRTDVVHRNLLPFGRKRKGQC